MTDEYDEVTKRLEYMNNVPKDFESGCMLSQAISLKRIADALERLQVPPKQPIAMDAKEYARYLIDNS